MIQSNNTLNRHVLTITFIFFTFTFSQSVKKIYAQQTEDIPFYQWPVKGTTETEGWVETTWHQSDHFKNFCPQDPDDNYNRSTVGCIATAMAQVVNYHRYIGDLHFDNADKYITDWRSIHIDADSAKYDFPGFGRFNKHLDRIKSKYQQNESLDTLDQAALSFACGIAIKMNYSSNASTIYMPKEIVPGLINKLGYHSADYIKGSDKDFYNTLIENIINGLPAILILSDHALVVDGYNTNGQFHLNFGWKTGNHNGWYRLPEDLDKKIDFGVLNIKSHIHGIDPEFTVTDDLISLPTTTIDEASEITKLTIQNTGETPLHIDNIISSPQFYVSLEESDFNRSIAPAVLQPGEELLVNVIYIPDSLGQLKGKLQVFASSNDVKKYLAIDLIGYGVPEKGTTITAATVSGTWTKAESPYYIGGDIAITAGKKLEIEAGTKIVFMGSYQFSVEADAQLIAKGTQQDSIHFSALNDIQGWQGLYFKESAEDDTLAYCVIKDGNTHGLSKLNRGLVSIFSTSPLIIHSRIKNNQSSFHGGAVYLDHSSASINHTIFEGNKCGQWGGAIYAYESSAFFSNVLITNNESTDGAAIYANNSSLSLVNATITNNTAQGQGGAIFFKGSKRLLIKNSIIWENNAAHGAEIISSSDTLAISYSNIDTTFATWLTNNGNYNYDGLFGVETGNISQDPQFTDPYNNDFTLLSGSPCIDTGDPADLAGEEPHPNGNRINMGAFGGTAMAAITAPLTSIDAANPIDFKLAQNYPNPFNSITTISWQLAVGSNVELSVYTIRGQKVATLVAQHQVAGYHKYELDAAGLASGVYIYRLVAVAQDGSQKNFTQVKKLVLAK